MKDLNKFEIECGEGPSVKLNDFSIKKPKTDVSVYFRDIEKHLIKHIKKADAVFGCVAWLTNHEILKALAKLKYVVIIVQKEDFLRPDIGASSNWKNELRKRYNKLSCELERYAFNNIISSLSLWSDPSIEAVRCVGNYNKYNSSAFPRMHNKFLIFAKTKVYDDNISDPEILPYGVWTGSFNFTQNATFSFENALYLTSPDIVNAFYQEFGQIAAISEPLDWETEWMTPQWRIGT